MKLLSKSIYALLFTGFSLIANASVEPTVSIRSQKGQSFSLHLKDMKNETYNIELSDKKGFVFLNETVEDQNDYRKLFNLKNLPAGNYRLRIENDYKVIFQNINVLKRQLTVDPATKREIYKPTIGYKSSYLNLNMIYFEEDIIRILIREKNNTVLYTEKIHEKGSINKRFDVTALPAGNYTAEVMTYYYTYVQHFSVGVDNKLHLKTSDNRRKKLIKKIEGVSKAQKDQLPYVTEAVMNKIKWLNNY